MSTKIYNGYRMRPLVGRKLLDLLKKTGEKVRAKQGEIVASTLASLSVALYDRWQVGCDEPPEGKSAYGIVYSELLSGITEIDKGYRNPMFDCEASITIFHLSDEYNNAMLFCEKQELTELIVGELNLDPCPYWNNADPDDEISEEDWDERGEEWEEILGDGMNPALAGLSFQFSMNRDSLLVDIDDVMKFIPPFDLRITEAAKSLAMQENIRNIKDSQDFSRLMDNYKDEFRQEYENRVRDILKPTLTKYDLLSK